jgi:hypothetical protein
MRRRTIASARANQDHFFMEESFLPHWYCFAGNTRLLWTTVLGDLFMGLSYVAISATLVRIIRRAGPDLPYQGFLIDLCTA